MFHVHFYLSILNYIVQKYRLYCKRSGENQQFHSEGMNLMCLPDETSQVVDTHNNVEAPRYIIPTSSSLQEHSFTSLNTHSQIEVSSNIGLGSLVEGGGVNVVYHPVAAADAAASSETTSTGGHSYRFDDLNSHTRFASNSYENYLLNFSCNYNDAALYLEQFDHQYLTPTHPYTPTHPGTSNIVIT